MTIPRRPMRGGPVQLPPGTPPEVVRQMVEKVLSGGGGPGPMPQPPLPGMEGAGAPPQPGQPVVPMPQEDPSTKPPAGAPKPGDPTPQALPPELVSMLQQVASDPQAAQQIEQILNQIKGPGDGDPGKVDPLEIIDPQRKMQLAQAWNSRKRSLGHEIMGARGMSPGGSRANDEALLKIWFRRPAGIAWEDVDDYADASRVYYVSNGWTDPDKIEDQVMREVFPLRESLIKTGRPGYKEQVEFTTAMVRLASRWIKKYGKPPESDPEVVAATQQGHGKPDTMPRDEDSEAFPLGDTPL